MSTVYLNLNGPGGNARRDVDVNCLSLRREGGVRARFKSTRRYSTDNSTGQRHSVICVLYN